jgi:nucleoside-diphosphate-sugar epimerase
MIARHILVTGATGKLGRAVCVALLDRGHRVRATDIRFGPDLGTELVLGDLRDELFVYRALEGCDAVVHLGNHPNAFAGPSRQCLLAENTAMNSNVVLGAVDLGIRDIVFASSVQVMLRSIGNSPPPYHIPYLPIDGEAPSDPGTNTYALSKEFCERLLRLCCTTDPNLAATTLRFPMLLGGPFLERLRERKRAPLRWVNAGELFAFTTIAEAAELVALVLAKRRPGYRQYFPARSQEPAGMSARQLIETLYPGVELRRPLEEIDALIDTSELEREFGWSPRERLTFVLDEE